MKRSMRATLVAALCVACAPGAFGSEAISKKAGCNACHLQDKKLAGPSYKEIAARYKGNAAAADLLAQRVRKGGKGVWGSIAMPPTDAKKLSDEELKAVIAWILKP